MNRALAVDQLGLQTKELLFKFIGNFLKFEGGIAAVQGPLHCASTIIKEEGMRGLWSGASPTVLRNGTNQMCLFWAKNHMDGVLLHPVT